MCAVDAWMIARQEYCRGSNIRLAQYEVQQPLPRCLPATSASLGPFYLHPPGQRCRVRRRLRSLRSCRHHPCRAHLILGYLRNMSSQGPSEVEKRRDIKPSRHDVRFLCFHSSSISCLVWARGVDRSWKRGTSVLTGDMPAILCRDGVSRAFAYHPP